MNSKVTTRKAGYGPTLREHLIRSYEKNEPHFAEAEAEIRRVEAEREQAKKLRSVPRAPKRPGVAVATVPHPAP